MNWYSTTGRKPCAPRPTASPAKPDPKSYSSGVVALMILLLMLTYLYGLNESQRAHVSSLSAGCKAATSARWVSRAAGRTA